MTDMNGVSAGSNIDDKSSGPRASRMRRSILLSAALVIVLGVAGFIAVNSNQSKKSLSGVVVTSNSTYKNVVTVAGGNGQGSLANQFSNPSGVAVDASGNVYVADKENHRVQKCVVSGTTWTCSTFAGSGQGPDANQFSYPFGVAVDGSGNVYVADSGNNRVQKFAPDCTTPCSGVTLASGLNDARGVAVDGSGNVYVADTYNNRVQKCAVSGTTWTCSTFAGGNVAGALSNQLHYPYGVAVDASGNVYVADFVNTRVQKFAPDCTTPCSGMTIASGFNEGPRGVAVDALGNVYIADSGNNQMRKCEPPAPKRWTCSTVAGGNGQGSAANQFSNPFGVGVDGSGNVYVADTLNHRVQMWSL